MVDAGEKGGLLAEILARLATYLENTARLRKKVKSAMMYPTVVTVVAIGITIFLLVKVVPVFGEIFAGFGAKLPAPTQYLINLSNVREEASSFLILIPAWPVRLRLASLISKPSKAANSGIARGSSCRSSASSRIRSVWRASPARWPR